MTTEREGIAGQDIDQDEDLERVEEEDMEATHGDKLQHAVDQVTQEAPDSEQERRTA